MNSQEDIRYLLTTYESGEMQAAAPYKFLQGQIKSRGFMQANLGSNSVKIYTAGLALILTSKEVPVRNMDNQVDTKIDGFEYLKSYVEAFKKGEQFFLSEFRVAPEVLYGTNAEEYVRDIHLNYFHIRHEASKDGWVYVKRNWPFILTHKDINKFGYYSGVVSKVDEQVAKHPQLFKDFDKCDLELHDSAGKEAFTAQSEQSETKALIKVHFDLLDTDKGWEYAFRNENDFNTFVDVLTSFFEHQETELPKDIIRLTKSCKTRLGATLGQLHSELGRDKLKGDTKFFEIVRKLNHFKDLTDVQLYKDLTRH